MFREMLIYSKNNYQQYAISERVFFGVLNNSDDFDASSGFSNFLHSILVDYFHSKGGPS